MNDEVQIDPPLDVMGNVIEVGDTIAAGMAFNRSSVLRVGRVKNIVAVVDGAYSVPRHPGDRYVEWVKRTNIRYNITVEWTNTQNEEYGRPTNNLEGLVSTIKMETSFTYSKIIVLNKYSK